MAGPVEEYLQHNEFPIPVLREHWPLLADPAFQTYLKKIAVIHIRLEAMLERKGMLDGMSQWERVEYVESVQSRQAFSIIFWKELMAKIRVDQDRADYIQEGL